MPEDGQVDGSSEADILAWTEGWTRSRGVSSPRRISGGVHIHVDTGSESGRYVLTEPDTARARELASQVAESNFWVKWPKSRAEAEPTMPEGWQLVEPQFLMTTRLEPATPLLRDGYRLVLDDEGDALEARALTDTGIVAARGRLGLAARAVPDQIVTQLEHQRRGLGQAIMRTLSNAALDRGRTDAVLLASAQGRRLYAALGWRVLSPFWAAVQRA